MWHGSNQSLRNFLLLCLFLGGIGLVVMGCSAPPNGHEAPQENVVDREDSTSDASAATEPSSEAASEPMVDASETSGDGGNESSSEPTAETTEPDGGTSEGGPETTSCGPGEIFFIDRCLTASEFCPLRYSGSKSALEQPYVIVVGTSFCQTAKGYFYLPGSGYGACDKDGDGWVTIEGFRAMSYSLDEEAVNKQVQANARCTVRTIDAIVYTRDHYTDKTFVQKLPAPAPLLETSRNDGQGPANEQPIYTKGQAPLPVQPLNGGCDDDNPCTDGKHCYLGHCLEGEAIDPKYRNSLTKACISGMDLNHNGITDAKETPSSQASPQEFQDLLTYGYYVELYHGFYSENYGKSKLRVYNVIERSRGVELGKGGLPLSCSKTQTTSSNYWSTCQLRDDQKCSTGTGHAAKGLSDCWMSDVQRALPSLFKCVVFQDTDTKGYFYTGMYGSAKSNKHYHRPTCSMNGTVNVKLEGAQTTKSLQFQCSSDNSYNRNPQGGQVGWACVNAKTYASPSEYLAGCIDECTESTDASGTQPCGNVYSSDKCFRKSDSYGQAEFSCTEKQSSNCSVGRMTCSDGKAGVCGRLTIIKPDQVKDDCDGKDDDCDGKVDEDFVSVDCYTDTRGCKKLSSGRWSCNKPCATGKMQCLPDGGSAKVRCVGSQRPTDELCDGIDNDCDGKVDEHPSFYTFDVGNVCHVGSGECKTAGKIVCSSSKGWVCNAKAASPPSNPLTGQSTTYEHVCGDQKDTDCNGYIDDYCVMRISGQFGKEGYSDSSSNSQHAHPRGLVWARLTYRIGSGTTRKDQEVLFVADSGKHVVRLLRLSNDGRTVASRHTIAGQIGKSGNQNGPGLSAEFNDLGPMIYSAKHKKLFVASRSKNVIKAIELSPDSKGNYNFNVTTVAGQYNSKGNVSNTSGSQAKFGWIYSLALSDDEDSLFVLDYSYHNVRKVDLGNQNSPNHVTVVAGSTAGSSGNSTGSRGTDARFKSPRAMTFYKSGSKRYLFVGVGYYNTIRRIDIDNNYKVDTLVSESVYKQHCWGGSKNSEAVQNFAAYDGYLYVTSYKGHRYCVFNATKTNTFVRGVGKAGDSGKGDFQSTSNQNPFRGLLRFYNPWSITVRTSGNGTRIIYISEYNNHTIRAHVRRSSPQ